MVILNLTEKEAEFLFWLMVAEERAGRREATSILLKNALELVIDKLETYVSIDEMAQMNGVGCLVNPKKTVKEWTEEIRKIERGEDR